MKQTILNTVSDLVGDFVYYDRKESTILSAQQLKDAVDNGIVTIDEMVWAFKIALENAFKKESKNENSAIVGEGRRG